MILMSIKSGSYMLGVVPVTTGGYAVELHHEEDGRSETIFKQDQPVSIWLKTANGEALLVSASYRDSALERNKLLLAGEARSDGGTVIRVEDVYEAGQVESEGVFQLSRKVTVVETGRDAEGFTSQFGMEPILGGSLNDYEMFAPGVWYRGSENLVETAIASNYSRSDVHMREMRLALPFLLMRNSHTGYSLSVGRVNASSSSDADETSPDWLVDETMHYGSFGISTGVSPSLQFRYPGWEGDINYIDRSVPWIRRSHPVRSGLSHGYRLLLRLECKSKHYAEAMRGAWRFFYEAARPEIKRLDLSTVYRNAVNLLDQYCQDYNGVLGLPFKAQLPTGEVTGHAMVMGFVGQQLPAAYQMIRHGYLRDEPSLVRKGIDIVDFWVQRSLTKAGVPKTWYEPFFEGTGNFTNGTLDLRTMSDGMEGALDAYLLMKRHGAEREDWLCYIARFGDWLAANQNEDGSYCRLYGLKGEPVHPGKHNTTNPVRFLLRLHEVTGLPAYRDAALRAGNYAYEQVYERFHYVGGTSDNDNTIDKEAGTMAMNAFLALYEHTGKEKWLKAFQGAADFTETWMFAWDYGLRHGGTRWEARDSSLPQWIMVDMEKAEVIQEVQIRFYPDNSMYEIPNGDIDGPLALVNFRPLCRGAVCARDDNGHERRG
ncbi:hypothetical protein PAT3040_04366 [Paenibacillus agaridevorans]|uniref:Uncharacterized protein n=1 Tax=Paenibacillus agaridevorans TaxID=171404 RepID=A0A2R5ET32_9BACL|nr:hypothetical protein [Paenibacillus agaridevorans]GBG09707.1 hypothetical protein PAT3040_04366 [Paenibacillus agaridevorans]